MTDALTIRAAARRLGHSARWLRNLIGTGHLSAAAGSRIPIADLVKLQESARVSAARSCASLGTGLRDHVTVPIAASGLGRGREWVETRIRSGDLEGFRWSQTDVTVSLQSLLRMPNH